ncbi:MAG: PLP-dependent transferase [Nocardioides sp.]
MTGAPSDQPAKLGPDTRAVRTGIARSQFAETSEGLYLTSGYVYENAAEAAAAFAGETDRYMYSRFGNLSLTAFADRLAALEGAQACFPGLRAAWRRSSTHSWR